MSDKILVTGINGFVGHHVAIQLSNRGYSVVGVGNQDAVQNELKDIVSTYISCDLTDQRAVKDINLHGVKAIINLAGFAKVGASRGQGEIYNKVNVGVHAVLYQECLNQGVNPRIIAVSTGAVYDNAQKMPLTEDSRLVEDSLTNEYVISKKLAEVAVSSFRNKGLRCIIARPFNHTGPGQLPGFLLPDLAEQIDISVQNSSPLMTGNLDTKRDFTDVRDVAEAYIELATCDEAKLQHDVYNICSGTSIAGRYILELLLKAMHTTEIETAVDPSKLRPNDVLNIYGSNERIHQALGWSPKISIEKTIVDFVSCR